MPVISQLVDYLDQHFSNLFSHGTLFNLVNIYGTLAF